MKYAFFPGCSLESTAWDFDRSTRATCGALGIELTDVPDCPCCENFHGERTMGKFFCRDVMPVRRCPPRILSGNSVMCSFSSDGFSSSKSS